MCDINRLDHMRITAHRGDRYETGGEMYTWEFLTLLSKLGINTSLGKTVRYYVIDVLNAIDKRDNEGR